MQHNCKIPTTIPMFSRSKNSMKLFLMLCYASGSQKSKMVAHKSGILISQLVYSLVVSIPIAVLMYLRLKNSAELFLILCNASGRQQSKMAANKLEILISQPVYNLATQFQRLYPYLEVQEFNKTVLYNV